MIAAAVARSIGRPTGRTVSKGVGATVLRREADGTVTIVSLAPAWRATLTRQPDGTVTIQG